MSIASNFEHASLSARRAWIEISDLKGNFITNESLSARRAWIEIWHPQPGGNLGSVALRKESVDRNKVLLAGCK